jgi:hypothetical protein
MAARIQPYVAAPPPPPPVHVRRYDVDGKLSAVDDTGETAAHGTLPPLLVASSQTSYHGRMSTRVRERNAERHSQIRAQRRRRAESRSPSRAECAAAAAAGQPAVDDRRLPSGFRTDRQAAKRRSEVQDAREAMTWDALRQRGGASDGSGGGWQPAVSANFRHAGDLHSAQLSSTSPESKVALNQTSPKRKKGSSKARRKRGGSERGSLARTGVQPWEEFRLPDVVQSPTALAVQPWAAQLAGDGWQGTGTDADFSPWGAMGGHE